MYNDAELDSLAEMDLDADNDLFGEPPPELNIDPEVLAEEDLAEDSDPEPSPPPSPIIRTFASLSLSPLKGEREAPESAEAQPTKKRKLNTGAPKTTEKKKPGPKAKGCPIVGIDPRTKWGDVILTDFELPKTSMHLMTNEYLEELYGEYAEFARCVFEDCPDTHRFHAHLYLIFSRGQRPRWSKLKRLFPHQHIEWRHGTRAQAAKYVTPDHVCKKKGENFGQKKKDYTFLCGPWEFGTLRDKGQRSDLKVIREFVWNCDTLGEFWRSEYGFNQWCVSHQKWVETQFLSKPRPNLTRDLALTKPQRIVNKLLDAIDADNRAAPGGVGRRFLVWQDPRGRHGKTLLITWNLDNRNAHLMVGNVKDACAGFDFQPRLVFDIARSAKKITGNNFSNNNARRRNRPDCEEDYFPSVLLELFANAAVGNTKYQVFTKRFVAPSCLVVTNNEDLPYKSCTYDRWLVVRTKADHSMVMFSVNSDYKEYGHRVLMGPKEGLADFKRLNKIRPTTETLPGFLDEFETDETRALNGPPPPPSPRPAVVPRRRPARLQPMFAANPDMDFNQAYQNLTLDNFVWRLNNSGFVSH